MLVYFLYNFSYTLRACHDHKLAYKIEAWVCLRIWIIQYKTHIYVYRKLDFSSMLMMIDSFLPYVNSLCAFLEYIYTLNWIRFLKLIIT